MVYIEASSIQTRRYFPPRSLFISSSSASTPVTLMTEPLGKVIDSSAWLNIALSLCLRFITLRISFQMKDLAEDLVGPINRQLQPGLVRASYTIYRPAV